MFVCRLSHRTVSQLEEEGETEDTVRERENTKDAVKSVLVQEGEKPVIRVEDDEPRGKPLPTSDVAMDTSQGEEEGPYFPAHPISYFPADDSLPDQMEGVEILSPHSSVDPQPPPMLALISGALQTANSFPPEGTVWNSIAVTLLLCVCVCPVVAAQLEEVASSPFSQVKTTIAKIGANLQSSNLQVCRCYEAPPPGSTHATPSAKSL